MAFFDDVPIRAEAVELFDKYQTLMQISAGEIGKKETAEKYIDNLERVIELQQVMYFRAKYSEEDDAFEFCQHLKQCANMLGYDGDVEEVFTNMQSDISKARKAMSEFGG